jgi:hypothetical protein
MQIKEWQSLQARAEVDLRDMVNRGGRMVTCLISEDFPRSEGADPGFSGPSFDSPAARLVDNARRLQSQFGLPRSGL